MSDAVGDVREDDCKHGYPRRLCLACKSAHGPSAFPFHLLSQPRSAYLAKHGRAGEAVEDD